MKNETIATIRTKLHELDRQIEIDCGDAQEDDKITQILNEIHTILNQEENKNE